MTRISKFYLFLIVASVAYGIATWNLKFGTPGEPKSGFFPLLVWLLLMGTSVGLFLDSLKKGDQLKHLGVFPPRTALVRIGCVLVLLIAYIAFFETLGFIICTTVLLLCLLKMLDVGSWLKIICICAFLVGGAFLLFDQVLDVPLPMGVLEDIL